VRAELQRGGRGEPYLPVREKPLRGWQKRLAQFQVGRNAPQTERGGDSAAGVSSAATTRAIRCFLLRLVAVLERLANRILTRMTL